MDPETRTKVLRQITYGLYVLTARSGDEISGATVSWLSQCSFDPPEVMVALRDNGEIHSVVERSGTFAVHTVGKTQKDVAAAFSRTCRVEKDRINGYSYERGASTGSPLLVDLPAWFEARVVGTLQRGDHTVFVAEVVDAGIRDDAAEHLVLADTTWNYGG